MEAVSAMPDPPLHEQLIAIPLSVVFAEGDLIEAIRANGEGVLPLGTPCHVSDEDAYFVLPEDIGLEIVDILRDGDLDLVYEAVRDGLLAVGPVERGKDGGMVLCVEECLSPREALSDGAPYGAVVMVGAGRDAVTETNLLDHAQCTMLSALVDEDGLEAMLRRKEFVGTSWRVPPKMAGELTVEPTYAWSRRLPDGSVGIELALFQEDDELVALLRPVAFRALA